MANLKDKLDVSIIVCCYNSKWVSLLFTLESIICQENISYEIIIADDGSKDNLKLEIENYFNSKKFANWLMVCSERNQGTVKNIYSALKVANGKYVKTISPGDAIIDKYTLRNWIDYNNSNGYRWSFSDAIYYVDDIKERKYVSANSHPNNITPYIKHDSEKCRWNYLVLDDIALGAAFLCECSLELEYEEIIKDHVIYAEDNIWRIMMFDGIVGGYYPKDAILYEYGTGISTSGSDWWSDKLEQDWNASNEIMRRHCNSDDIFQKRVVKAWNLKKRGKLYELLVPGKIKGYIYRKFWGRKTSKYYG